MEYSLQQIVAFVSKKWMLDVLMCFQGEDELRFHHFENRIEKVSNKTLSKRLKELIDEGFVEKREMEASPPKTCYVLTANGEELLDFLSTLERCCENWNDER